MKKILGFLSFIILVFNPEYFSQYLWVNTNASLGSKVNAIVVNSNNEVFACTDSSGIYFSPDLGNSWLPVNNGLTSSTIIALAVSPTTQTLTALDYSGLYRSIDNGSSWFQVNLTSSVFRLDCNLNGDFFGGTTVGGVIKSMDDGVSWFYSNSGLTQYSIYSFAFEDTAIIFCSSYNGAVYQSNDFGDTWCPIFLPYGSGDIIALAVFDSVLYAGARNNGVYSTNYYDQITWTERNNGLLNKNITNIRINLFGYIYVSTSGGIFRSLNSAAGWD